MSKYSEDSQFENYGKDKCENCEKIKKKLERKVGIKQNTIDVLERELKNMKKHHWDLVRKHCILSDKLQELGYDEKIV